MAQFSIDFLLSEEKTPDDFALRLVDCTTYTDSKVLLDDISWSDQQQSHYLILSGLGINPVTFTEVFDEYTTSWSVSYLYRQGEIHEKLIISGGKGLDIDRMNQLIQRYADLPLRVKRAKKDGSFFRCYFELLVSDPSMKYLSFPGGTVESFNNSFAMDPDVILG